jgi:DNA-binding MarR family transcriptional regulator
MADDISPPDLAAALAAAAGVLKAQFRREMSARGFTAHEGAAGEALLQLTPAGVAQATLTARMGLSKQAVQQLLDQLEAGRYIRREADPADKRQKRVALTEFGQREFVERRKVLAAIEEQAKERLGKKLLGKLDKSLRKLTEN